MSSADEDDRDREQGLDDPARAPRRSTPVVPHQQAEHRAERPRSRIAAVGAAISTSRAPAITRDSTSRPSWSVPRRWSALGRGSACSNSLIGSYGVIAVAADRAERARTAGSATRRRSRAGAGAGGAARGAAWRRSARMSIGGPPRPHLAEHLIARPPRRRRPRRRSGDRARVGRRDVRCVMSGPLRREPGARVHPGDDEVGDQRAEHVDDPDDDDRRRQQREVLASRPRCRSAARARGS